MKRGHKQANLNLTQAELKEVLRYEPETGKFFWRVSLARRNRVGDEAGWVNAHAAGKRIKIAIRNTDYMAHRLAWLYMTGKWPEFEIDHKNGDGLDNRWENLRTATPSENMQHRGVPSNNTTGHKGTCFDKKTGRFVAGIKVAGKRINLGAFDTLKEASEAYRAAAVKYYGPFARW